MREPSSLFKDLERRIDELSVKFVADQVAEESADILNFVPDLDRLAAYRLLAHAEIEDYLERKAKARITTIEARTTNEKWSATEDLSLYVLAALVEENLPFECPFNYEKFMIGISSVIKAARNIIESNNGVKASSFMKLSIIAGKAVDEVDGVLAASLNSFGKNRGDVAHRSVGRTTTIQAPSSEMKNILDIIKQLKEYFYGDAAPHEAYYYSIGCAACDHVSI